MKILFVGKRHPQQRDLIERPYGRFHHLPAGLADLGHEVRVLLVSHRRLPSVQVHMAGVDWIGEDVRSLGPRFLYRRLIEQARSFRPDWVVGMSDAWYGWLARRLAAAAGARLAIDAYDNYEAYMPWNLPLHWAWRRAVRAADLVTAAGPQLAARLQSHRRDGRRVEVIPMAADPSFRPLEKAASREALGLPENAPLAGYLGSWARNRGTDLLLEAFRIARAALPELRLVLSGKPPTEILTEPGVLGVGYVADAQLPALLNALDVACVITADTRFGRYSYPAKLCEAMACGVPVVATATEPVRWMLDNRADHLVELGNAPAFAERMLGLLVEQRVDHGKYLGWKAPVLRLHGLLTEHRRTRA
jgi:glycosyltransferase involved in cell wall biosynthesis